MSVLRAWMWRLGGLFGRDRRDRELAAELEAHVQMHIEDNLCAGMSPEEARRQALLKLGGLEQTKERYRDQRGFVWLESVLQDVRFGLRMLRKNPGFTTVAVLTLALGIGANTAIFSIVDAVLLRSLPFRDPGRLVAISETHPSMPEIGAAVADFEDWRTESHSFEGLAAYNLTSLAHATLIVHGEPQEVHGAIISHDLFRLLGITPSMGFNFSSQDDVLDNGHVAILSNEIWRTRFDADPKILGQLVTVNQRPYTVVGVLPAGLRFPQDTDVWIPLGNLDQDDRTNRFYHPLFAIGRLRPGVNLWKARAELAGIAAQLAGAYPQTNHDIGVKVEPLLQTYLGGLREYLLILWAAVGLVLLIACANVASLLLARATSREGEMGLRSALGASRARLIRQTVAEGVVLSLLGGVSGLLLAWAGLFPVSRWLPRMVGAPILRLHEIGIYPQVSVVTLSITIFAGLLFGIVPAIRGGRRGISATLQPGRHASPSARKRLAYRVAVGGEVALAAVVLISAGLLVRSLQQLLATSVGFRVDHLLTMRISLPTNQYQTTQAIDGFYGRLLPKLRASPGIDSVGTIDQTPLVPNLGVTRFLIDGATPVRTGDYPVANYRQVSPDYFQTMGIPLMSGRMIREDDLAGRDAVVIVNRTLAQQFFSGKSPIGRKLLLAVATGRPFPVTIVGVVGDVRDVSIDSPAPAEMYFPGFGPTLTLVVRSGVDPSSLAAAIRNVVLTVDASQSVFAVETGTRLVDDSIARQRVSALLLGSFSVLALILAIGGIYGVTSYAVAERTREIGIRLALGAQRGDVLRLIIGEGLVLAGIGICVGLAVAVGLTRLMANQLYGVSATDPPTYIGVAGILVCVALAACWIPARRAMRVDPAEALRYE